IYLKPDGLKADVERAAFDALDRLFHPLHGWQGSGWPFDRSVFNSDASNVLERVVGIDFIEGVTMKLADPSDQKDATDSKRKPNPSDGVALQPYELPVLAGTSFHFFHLVGTKWSSI